MGETSSSNGLTHWLLLIVFEFWEIRIIDYESVIDYESFFVLNSPNILALCERNLDDSGNFTVRGCFPLIWKDSTTHMLYDLAGYLKKGLPFARDLSLENSVDSYVFGWLYFTQSLTSFSSIDCLLRFYARFLIPFFSIKMIYTSLLTTFTI